MFRVGIVLEVGDEFDGGRIKAFINGVDSRENGVKDVPYAFPLLPKMLHVVPKVNEAVLLFCVDDDPNRQRFYIGPVVSQYQGMYFEHFSNALNMVNGFEQDSDPALHNIPESFGALGKSDDVILYGRKNSDIILSDSDVRIRCGVNLKSKFDTRRILFNKENPSLIKLKYHENPLYANKKEWSDATMSMSLTKQASVESSANIIAQEINLISTEGDPYVNTTCHNSLQNGNESVSDDEMRKFIENAHPLPYGDKLVAYLKLLTEAFLNHVHKYHFLPPCPGTAHLDELKGFNMNSLLSKNIRIN